MAVVKADGYGHGIVESGRAARAGGAGWLGVALLDEALTLRAAGDRGPILSWLAVPGEDYRAALEAGIEISAYSLCQLERDHRGRFCDRPAGRRTAQARLGTRSWRSASGRLACAGERRHGRSGRRSHRGHGSVVPLRLLGRARAPVRQGSARRVRGRGLARPRCGTRAGTPASRELRRRAGGAGGVVHDGATRDLALRRLAVRRRFEPGAVAPGDAPAGPGGTRQARPCRAGRLLRSHLHDDRTRPGSPWCRSDTATASLGTPPTEVRSASTDRCSRSRAGCAWTSSSSTSVSILAGRGDLAVLIGDPALGEPSAHDWAAASDTIGYEIVSRIGSRVPRRYVGEAS